MWKESVVAYLKVISQHFPGRTEEYYERFQSGLSIYGRDYVKLNSLTSGLQVS
jgi:hypothetical protein